METRLTKQMNTYDGGIKLLAEQLNKAGKHYYLTSKKPSVIAHIPTKYGEIACYDRRRNKLIRVNVPKNHPLMDKYKELGGFIYNEKNYLIDEERYLYVYFSSLSFENLVNYLKELG